MTGCIIFRKLLARSCLPFVCRFACVRATFFVSRLSSIPILPVHCNDEWCYFVCPVPCTFVVVFLLAFNNIHILLLPFFFAARRLHWLYVLVAHFSCVCVAPCVCFGVNVTFCHWQIPITLMEHSLCLFRSAHSQCLIFSTLSRASDKSERSLKKHAHRPNGGGGERKRHRRRNRWVSSDSDGKRRQQHQRQWSIKSKFSVCCLLLENELEKAEMLSERNDTQWLWVCEQRSLWLRLQSNVLTASISLSRKENNSRSE